MIFYNTETKEYPRHIGDLELLGWQVGESLPENWVEVEYVDPPSVSPEETYYPASEPILIDGVYKVAWNTRFWTEEELQAIEEQKNL